MNAAQWTQVRATFDAVLDLPLHERDACLTKLAGTDAEAARWVEMLVDGNVDAPERLERFDALRVPDERNSATSVSDPLDLAGKVVSHFRVVELIGVGGMGVVYRAEDLRLRRIVALKFLHPEHSADAAPRARFLVEAQSAATLDHPNICAVYEVGESEGRAFMAMPCYPGESLKSRLENKSPLPTPEVIAIAIQIARGLGAAHALGIVHRDLKPANLMIGPDGTVRILDFGLAKVRDLTLSDSGVCLGTPRYMSPEQFSGDAVDARTDLWSLGVVLFEMLHGAPPAGNRARGNATVPNGRATRAGAARVPEALARIVDRLLQRTLAKRYASADELLGDLLSLPDSVSLPRSPWRRLHVGRLKGAWLGLLAVVLLAGIGESFFWNHQSSARGHRQIADAQVARYSLAVLPLKNYSRDPGQDFFADGMTDELTTTLSKIGGLRVIAHQSVIQFRSSEHSAPEIGRLLGVRHLVDGSVTRDSNRVRITATLIDVSSNAAIWSDRFERERRDVMTLQHEVALAIANAIQIALTPQDVARLANSSPVDPEAFEQYLQGTQSRYAASGTADFRDAETHYARAIARDSSYAPAYAGLAFVEARSGNATGARLHVTKALQLDPALPETHMALGVLRQNDRDWAGAENAFRDALQLDPGHAEAHHELAMLLMRRRRFADALHEAKAALFFAPTSARFESGVTEVLLFSGRYDEALASVNRAIALDARYQSPYCLRGKALMSATRYSQALNAWNVCIAHGADARPELAYIQALTGQKERARSFLDTMKIAWRKSTGVAAQSGGAIDIATVSMGLGERRQALDWLERAFAGRGNWTEYVGIDPVFSPLRSEPRFIAILRKAGLEE